MINSNSKHKQNIQNHSQRTKGGRRLSSGPRAYGVEYRAHVKLQNSKTEIRQGKLKHISAYVAMALQEVFRDER